MRRHGAVRAEQTRSHGPGRKKRAAAVGAAAFVLAGSAALALPGQAAAAPPLIAGSCGSTFQGTPGQPVSLNVGALVGRNGPYLALGTVQPGTQSFSVPGSQLLSLLGGIPIIGWVIPSVCTVTVTGVNAAAAPVQDGAAAVAQGVQSGANALSGGFNQGSQPAPGGQSGGPGGAPGAGQAGGPGHGGAGGPAPAGLPDSGSEVLGGGEPLSGALPTSFATGYAPMRDYSSLPAAAAGLFSPSPGVRYGGQIPGYAPQFGVLGQGGQQNKNGVQNAGKAEALPGNESGGPGAVGLPILLAVIALSGASAALVRTWVLRKTTAA